MCFVLFCCVLFSLNWIKLTKLHLVNPNQFIWNSKLFPHFFKRNTRRSCKLLVLFTISKMQLLVGYVNYWLTWVTILFYLTVIDLIIRVVYFFTDCLNGELPAVGVIIYDELTFCFVYMPDSAFFLHASKSYRIYRKVITWQ